MARVSPTTDGDSVPPDAQRLRSAYERVRQYIDVDLVRLTPRPNDPEGKVAAARAFNRELGDPQRSFPAIQVAGTSGKGSTAYMLARILAAAGYRTGLHTSPYLQVMTEKTWISGRLVGALELESACERVREVADGFHAIPSFPASVHGLASLALSFVEFQRCGVDVAVVETCVGGRYDLVQGLNKALAVITDIGLDHTHILGGSLEQIAWHKAGIMEPGVPCVASVSGGFSAIEAESRLVGCPLVGVTPSLSGVVSHSGEGGILDLPGFGAMRVAGEAWPAHQRRNAALAAAAAHQLRQGGWRIEAEHVSTGLTGPKLPERIK